VSPAQNAKRAAHTAAIAQADQAQALADASAARTWPIAVHLTPFAPGCARLRIDDKRRWRTFYGRTVEQVVRSTLARLALPASACTAAQEGPHDVALMAAVPLALVQGVSSRPGEPVPHALFWDGVSVDQLKAVLADLTARGWKPPEPIG
jgi:citrate lyase gamma subunit